VIRAARSEFIKLRQPAYAVTATGMVAFMAVSMVISVGGAGDRPSERGPAGLVLSRAGLEAADGLGRSLGNSVTFLGIVALTIVAINVGGEYSHGTVRNLLVRQPRRARLLLGKTVTLLAYLAVAVVVTALVGVAVAAGVAAGDIDTGAWWSGPGVAATAAGAANLVVAVCGWGALGLLLAVLLRSAPATIGIGVAYALPFEILVGEVAPAAARWLPGQLLQALARGGTPEVDHAVALAGAGAWLVVAVGVALVVFRTRDVTH
jgi:ABC-2 type transport system permease protein